VKRLEPYPFKSRSTTGAIEKIKAELARLDTADAEVELIRVEILYGLLHYLYHCGYMQLASLLRHSSAARDFMSESLNVKDFMALPLAEMERYSKIFRVYLCICSVKEVAGRVLVIDTQEMLISARTSMLTRIAKGLGWTVREIIEASKDA